MVTEKKDWDLKIINQKSSKKDKDIISMESFNKNNVLINKEISESSLDEKNINNFTEKIFPEYNRNCEEDAKTLDGKFQNSLADQFKSVFQDEQKPFKYLIKFDVTPDYKIVVKKINDKEITADLNSLDSNEIKILTTINNSPIKYLEGVLRKIAGKDAKTAFNIPVHWMGSSY